MISLDPACASKISYRPGYLLDPVVGPSAEVQICDRLLQEFHTIGIQYTMLPQQPRRHPCVAGHLAFFAKPFQLDETSMSNSLPDGARGFFDGISSQVLEFHRRHFHMNIDPVHQGAR